MAEIPSVGSPRSVAALLSAGLLQLLGVLVAMGSAFGWSCTNPFHYADDALLLRIATPELLLLIGVMAYLSSTVGLVAVLELRLMARGRRQRLATLGFVPVLGVAAYFSLAPGSDHRPAVETGTKGQAVPAVIMIGLALLMVPLVVGSISGLGAVTPQGSIDPAVANREAYAAVTAIIEAQAEYIERDWDGDGEKEYARFLVHLWHTPRRGAAAVEVGLLAEALAIARVAELAFHGFVFRNLHHDDAPPVEERGEAPRVPEASWRPLDYRRRWALAAEPVLVEGRDDETARLQFIARSDGRVFGRQYVAGKIERVPAELERAWSSITSLADVVRLQRKGPSASGP